MSKFIAVVRSTSQTVETLVPGRPSIYPLIVYVPEKEQGQELSGGYRTAEPERWVEKNVLPSHPSCEVTLYRAGACYVPATHRRVGSENES